MKKLIIIGAGGYSKSVLDSVDSSSYEFIGFLDEFYSGEHLGYPILYKGLEDIKNKTDYCYFIAIGNNAKRKKWFDLLEKENLEIINVIDQHAIISNNAKIGKSVFIGKLAIVNSNAIIGDNCIVNTKALIEHGCKMHNHVNLSTNATINGDVVVKDGAFIGSSSVVIGQKSIGKMAVVGAGAVVVNDVDDNTTVVGIPAKPIKKAYCKET